MRYPSGYKVYGWRPFQLDVWARMHGGKKKAPQVSADGSKEKNDFVAAWNETAIGVHQANVENGWWEKERNDGENIALMHSELSEALEALRGGNPPDRHLPEFDSLSVELADTVIRIMDFAKARRLKVAEALLEKNQFNRTRGHKHGGKRF